ncbi:MAG: rubrerythrin family protein [Elusimicrobiales bacterium]|nr:rubrerythrin family protein [Elusimicrobiales bacterium]
MGCIKGTQTEKNLITAFAGESQARNRYTYFAGQARKDGFVQIAEIFTETAEQEKEHAKRFFKFLEGGEAEVSALFPAGMIKSTAENLAAAAAGENYEWGHMYPTFAATARKEGFEAVAAVFDYIAVAEKQHAKRYAALLENVKAGKVFKRDSKVVWRCLNCGYLHEGTEAPDSCPACAHPRDYYEILGENW